LVLVFVQVSSVEIPFERIVYCVFFRYFGTNLVLFLSKTRGYYFGYIVTT
jgi:hypothetical protein